MDSGSVINSQGIDNISNKEIKNSPPFAPVSRYKMKSKNPKITLGSSHAYNVHNVHEYTMLETCPLVPSSSIPSRQPMRVFPRTGCRPSRVRSSLEPEIRAQAYEF